VPEIAAHQNEFYLVLDDYHEIQAPELHIAMELFIDYMPPNIHLVLASRSDPPLPLARIRARSEIAELHSAELAFTEDEAEAFIRQVIGLALEHEDIHMLVTKTEGWITGLQLAGITMQADMNYSNTLRDFINGDRHIVDYLTDEVLNLQTPEVREFLLCTASLDRLESSLCNSILNRQDSQRILDELERKNLFLTPLDNRRQWFRYHALFRSMLNDLLVQECPSRILELHRRASDWYRSNGFVRSAIRHAYNARDYCAGAEMIEQNAELFWSRNEFGPLQQWLDTLPGDVLKDRPRLTVYRAWVAVLNGLLKEGESLLVEAENAMNANRVSSQDELWGMLYAIQGIFSRMRGDNPLAIELSEKAIELLPSDNLNWHAVALITLGIAFNALGEANRSNQAFSQAIALSSIAQNKLTSVVSAAQYAQLLISQGQLRLAARTCNQALEFAKIQGLRGFSQASRAYTSLAQIYREWDQLEQAREFQDKAVELSQANNNMRNLIEADLERVRWLHASGDPEQAKRLSEQIEFKIREFQLGEFLTEALSLKARLAIYTDDLETALEWTQSRGMNLCSSIDFSSEVECLTFSRLLLRQGKNDLAINLLDRMETVACQAGRKGRWMEIRLLQALAYEQSGRPRKAVQVLQQILPEAEREGYKRIFLDEGDAVAAILARIYRSSNPELIRHRSFIHSLIDALKEKEMGRDRTNQMVQGLLTVKEKQVVELLADGYSRNEIANVLVVSATTIDSHIKNIYQKLGAHNRVEAIRVAREIGVIGNQ